MFFPWKGQTLLFKHEKIPTYMNAFCLVWLKLHGQNVMEIKMKTWFTNVMVGVYQSTTTSTVLVGYLFSSLTECCILNIQTTCSMGKLCISSFTLFPLVP